MTYYRIHNISFNFEDDDFELPVSQQQDLLNYCKRSVWNVDESSDTLVEHISRHCGWRVTNIAYEECNNYGEFIVKK